MVFQLDNVTRRRDKGLAPSDRSNRASSLLIFPSSEIHRDALFMLSLLVLHQRGGVNSLSKPGGFY